MCSRSCDRAERKFTPNTLEKSREKALQLIPAKRAAAGCDSVPKLFVKARITGA